MDSAARAQDQEESGALEDAIAHLTTAPSADLTAPSRITGLYERGVKPVIDWVGALVLLILTLPLLAACALAIVATLGRPVILRQPRVGQFGRVFTLYKFRTMEPDRRHLDVPFIGDDRRKTHKDPNDPRITALGRFLRVWSLDELPQFINVLKGDMSLVGPRPELVEIVAQYEEWQHERHLIKPGVTGLWQISDRGEKMLHECTDTDLEYLAAVSAWTDIKILLRTPLAALGLRKGA